MNGYLFTGVQPQDVAASPQKFIDAYKKHGLVCFRGVSYTEETAYYLAKPISDAMGFMINPEGRDCLHWHYQQDHDIRLKEAIEIDDNNDTKLLIEWHIEGVSLKYPQYGALWHMTNFKANSSSGSTGFVDMCRMYEDLDPDSRDLLHRSKIIHHCNWQHGMQDEKVQTFKAQVDLAIEEIYTKDGDLYVASHARNAIDPHPGHKRPVLRICPCYCSYGPQDYLLSVEGRRPTDHEQKMYDSISEWVHFEVQDNEERQLWHHWQEGDVIITDLFRMAHGVRAGFEPGQRSFDGYWFHEHGTPAQPFTLLEEAPEGMEFWANV